MGNRLEGNVKINFKETNSNVVCWIDRTKQRVAVVGTVMNI